MLSGCVGYMVILNLYPALTATSAGITKKLPGLAYNPGMSRNKA